MKTHAPAQETAEQRAVAVPHVVNHHSQAAHVLEDARPETAGLQRLHDMATDSPRTTQLKTLQAMINASPRGQSLQAMRAMQRRPNNAPFTPDEAPVQRAAKSNTTGLPDQLKSGIESLSGMSMDLVKVHYNSDKPAQLQAHAYAQGNEIYVAPGQEHHLPHEAWHVVQQAQGRVRPNVQMKGGVPVNDDVGLEQEADLMGERALRVRQLVGKQDVRSLKLPSVPPLRNPALQRKKSRPGDAVLLGLITKLVTPNAVPDPATDDVKANAVWSALDTSYETNKAKGATLIHNLNTKVAEFKDAGTKQSVIDALTLKDKTNSGKFAANYAHTTTHLERTRYRVNTAGYDPASGAAKPVVDAGEYSGAYSNEFDVGTGEITAAWNFADQDDARAANKGINNSEILWNQHKEAAEKHFDLDLDKDAKVNAAMKSISKIIRSTVINLDTKRTVYMAYPDGETWDTMSKSWIPGSDDFNAILGTDNARSTPFLLMDHIHDLEKTIDKIETKKPSDIEIAFKAI